MDANGKIPERGEKVVAVKEGQESLYGEARPKFAITAEHNGQWGPNHAPRFEMRLRLYQTDAAGTEYLGLPVGWGCVPASVAATILAELAMAWGWDGGGRKAWAAPENSAKEGEA